MLIKSSFGPYNVQFLNTFEEAMPYLKKQNFRGALVDDFVYQRYLSQPDILPTANVFRITPNEQAKQYRAMEAVFEWMCQSRFDRESELLAIGGGTIQDVATYVSAVFHRGIRWTFVPTTLLAQADSCIGGKCGLNVTSFKNQVGLVYPPKHIYSVNSLLNSLTRNDLISGMGEIIKIAVTGRWSFWDQYRSMVSGRRIEELKFDEIIPLALRAKRYVIEKDEMELSYRKVLNYGHTLGHAIEASSDFSVPHGVAVILGVKAVSRLGEIWKITPKDLSADIQSECDWLLKQYDSSIQFNVSSAISMIKHDKKTHGNRATFIVLAEIGKHQFVSKDIDDELSVDLASALHELTV